MSRAALRALTPPHARLGAAADRLTAIISQLSQAVSAHAFPLRGGELAAIASAVQSGEAHTALAETASPAANAVVAANAAVTTAAAETRNETKSLARDVFDRHVFDPYLHYSSPQDEEESRRRQAADKRYIADQFAKHTPEGNLNASGGMIELHARPARPWRRRQPEFMPRWNALVNKAETQRNAMKAAGQSTDEFDRHVNASVRQFLKDEKGLSDAESEKRAGSFANPLDAAKSLLNEGSKSGDTKRDKPTTDTHASLGLDAIRAKMQAVGVKLADNDGADPNHGVNASKPPVKDGAALG